MDDEDDEETTVRTLTAYRNAITDLVQQFRGRVVDAPGDNILAERVSHTWPASHDPNNLG